MIRARHLTKTFNGHKAVDDISFEISSGEIIGLLGPNGAGKTTTMRMLTGFLNPTQGLIEVAGIDVFKNTIEARRHIGYMPENSPLYSEMRVDEYLNFRARIKGVARHSLKSHRNDIKEMCGLTDVSRRIIGQLSRGYRQRVALADSLLNAPDILILDEPTAGLDPIQIREVRELIKSLSKDHTILLSTHILPEAELTCKKIIIINQGKIVASDSPKSLYHRLQNGNIICANIQGDPAEIAPKIMGIDSVKHIEHEPLNGNWNQYRVDSTSDNAREQIFYHCVSNGWKLRELYKEECTLEDIFIALTSDKTEQEEVL